MRSGESASARKLERAARSRPTRWIELDPDEAQPSLGDAVREGLAAIDKTLPSQFFYDTEGSRLFEQICELPEYYLTRAEAEILEASSPALARQLSRIETIVELGSGSAVKTEFLLRAFEADGRALAYAPIDVSRSALEESVERLEDRHPDLEILPARAEYEAGLAELARLPLGEKLVLWLGSSIGNLRRGAAEGFLGRLGRSMGARDRLLVGVDLRKDRAVLEAAYDDAQGITARFDLNLLARINRELAGEFDLDLFRHRVHYDEPSGSVQSFLESQCDQTVRIADLDLEVQFEAGERIHTEDSHKYSLEEIEELAAAAALRIQDRFLDAGRRFALVLMATAGPS